MKNLLYLIILLPFFIIPQENGFEYCSHKKINSKNLPISFNYSDATVHSFDVLNYKLELDIYNCFISPYPKSFTGKNTITFRVDSTLSTIKLDAVNTSMVIDSIHAPGISFTHSNNILTVILDRTYAPGEIVNLPIFYRHLNVNDNAFYASGGTVFTDCEPEGARKWFPSWDKPYDKATLDLTARTPVTVKLGSNGRLADSINTGNEIYYRWISRDPIATYLMVISARVNYNLEIISWAPSYNPSDITPIRLYSNPGETIPTAIRNMIIPMFEWMSDKFGPHPFEKNGFATLNSQFTWGGMENQTLTSLCPNCWTELLIVHEAAHQWFGDMISPNSWADIFLNEGFATYIEALWREFTVSEQEYRTRIQSYANSYFNNNPGWAISNPDWAINTPSTSVLFNTAITYRKSACILYMLREMLGDEIFFAGIKAYATDVRFKYRAATIENLMQVMSTAAAWDLSFFFNQWIYYPNHPNYQIEWYRYISGDNYVYGVKVGQNNPSGQFFTMPLEFKVTYPDNTSDIFTVSHSQNEEIFYFSSNYSKGPGSISFDPGNKILLKTVNLNSVLPVELVSFTAQANGEKVFLKWQTAIELNNQGFFIERTSKKSPGIWEERGFVKGYGSSTGILDYTFIDVIQNADFYLYRLKQVDYDGSFEYSEAIEIFAGELPQQFALGKTYPNPVQTGNETKLNFEIPEECLVEIKLYDVSGVLIITLLSERINPGFHEVSIQTGDLSSGIYVAVMNAGGNIRTSKVAVIK